MHGRIVGRVLGVGRVECPHCAADREKIDAMRTGVPPRFISISLNDYVVSCDAQESALRTAKGYAESFEAALNVGAGLIFLGSVGTGKTHLACAIANHVRATGKTVRYSTVRHAVGEIRSTWKGETKMDEREALMGFVRPDLFILDEVGMQFGTEAERITLYDIIDGRYGQVRPTIVISNLSLADLEGTLGTRVVDRMQHNGCLVRFDWDSYRR